METNIIDRRVVKTKARIKDALILLMEQKELNEITIVELAEKALINRKTFYLHYSSIVDVLKEIETDVVSKLLIYIKNFDLTFAYLKEFLYNILNTISNDKYVFKIIVSTKYSKNMLFVLEKVIYDELYKKAIKANKSKKFLLSVEYNVYGSMELFFKWLTNSAISFDELVKFIYTSVENNFKGVR